MTDCDAEGQGRGPEHHPGAGRPHDRRVHLEDCQGETTPNHTRA